MENRIQPGNGFYTLLSTYTLKDTEPKGFTVSCSLDGLTKTIDLFD